MRDFALKEMKGEEEVAFPLSPRRRRWVSRRRYHVGLSQAHRLLFPGPVYLQTVKIFPPPSSYMEREIFLLDRRLQVSLPGYTGIFFSPLPSHAQAEMEGKESGGKGSKDLRLLF